MTQKPFYFFESQYCFQILDQGKEFYKSLKNIEKLFILENLKYNMNKIQNIKKKLFFLNNSEKILGLKCHINVHFKNQINLWQKKLMHILGKFIRGKQYKHKKNLFSKIFKFNLFICKEKKISGFLIHNYSLKYSKFLINNTLQNNKDLNSSIWDTIAYFIFFQIH